MRRGVGSGDDINQGLILISMSVFNRGWEVTHCNVGELRMGVTTSAARSLSAVRATREIVTG